MNFNEAIKSLGSGGLSYDRFVNSYILTKERLLRGSEKTGTQMPDENEIVRVAMKNMYKANTLGMFGVGEGSPEGDF